MNFSLKGIRFALIIALFCISLMGLLLHGRAHPAFAQVEKHVVNPDGTSATVKEKVFTPHNLIPWASGVTAIIIVTLLFCFKSTASYGFLITGMSVIIGSITMAHFSYIHFAPPFSVQKLMLNTLFGDIILLFGKFFLAKAIFDSCFIKEEKQQ